MMKNPINSEGFLLEQEEEGHYVHIRDYAEAIAYVLRYGTPAFQDEIQSIFDRHDLEVSGPSQVRVLG